MESCTFIQTNMMKSILLLLVLFSSFSFGQTEVTEFVKHKAFNQIGFYDSNTKQIEHTDGMSNFNVMYVKKAGFATFTIDDQDFHAQIESVIKTDHVYNVKIMDVGNGDYFNLFFFMDMDNVKYVLLDRNNGEEKKMVFLNK